jgi:hypothetical protein
LACFAENAGKTISFNLPARKPFLWGLSVSVILIMTRIPSKSDVSRFDKGMENHDNRYCALGLLTAEKSPGAAPIQQTKSKQKTES